SLDGRDGDRPGALAEDLVDGKALRLVVQMRAGAMRVDVIDARGVEPCALDRILHRAGGALALRMRPRDVVGVARKPEAIHEPDRRRAALAGGGGRLNDDRTGSLAEQ